MTAGDILTSGNKYPDRALKYPPMLPMLHDAQVLATRVTQLLTSYASSRPGLEAEPEVSSGYRPAEVNAMTSGAAKHSNHMVCRAVDIADAKGELAKWCVANLDLLEHHQLWMEAPKYTVGWVHLQSVPPKSNHRVFVP